MITLEVAIGIVVAGAVGAVLRALFTTLDGSFNRQVAGTLGINVVGSFLLGLVASSSTNTMLIAGIGGLGALTTFSAFISQVERITREGRVGEAVLYAVSSLITGVAAAYLGWVL